jgi:hypothetical protein
VIALLTTYVPSYRNLIFNAQTMFLTTPLFPFPKQHSKLLQILGLILITKEPKARTILDSRFMLSLGRPLQRPLARQHERGAPAASGEGRSGRSSGSESVRKGRVGWYEGRCRRGCSFDGRCQRSYSIDNARVGRMLLLAAASRMNGVVCNRRQTYKLTIMGEIP